MSKFKNGDIVFMNVEFFGTKSIERLVIVSIDTKFYKVKNISQPYSQVSKIVPSSGGIYTHTKSWVDNNFRLDTKYIAGEDFDATLRSILE